MHMGQYVVVEVDLWMSAISDALYGTSEAKTDCEDGFQSIDLPVSLGILFCEYLKTHLLLVAFESIHTLVPADDEHFNLAITIGSLKDTIRHILE